ncbi:PIN domain-containing protein [Mesorhizobium sp. B2-4-6]|uniref:PIN domain-containing protein n=1 Tax=Mesorhizobium sp. B2-4-6 TaxID=2589943 RepID=UPI00112C9212|nr:PIN domain-containing protein [Mesorhizobium sp. B2-4-6]TPL49827.1 hypothetical protein FJ957_12255 [Mesorhizobium sp. B2-4-6]
MKTIPIFVDTNAFIQMRDLKDIPWAATFPQASRIDIMVIMPVIKELEAFKVGPNERRRDRSRAALALIDEAMELDSMALEWKPGHPSVWLRVGARNRIEEARFPELDLAKTDDLIVAHAAVHGEGAIVFSHDRGPRISARAISVKTLKPEETWLLPPERSEKDRKIEQLERAARERHPKILLALGVAKESLEWVVPILPPLDPEEIRRKTDTILTQHPRASLRRVSDLEELMGHGVSQESADRYRREYDRFEQSVKGYFERLHKMVRRAALVIRVPYTVTNDSGIATKGLRIETAIEGDAWLAADRTDACRLAGIPALPSPPDVPTPRKMFELPIRKFESFGSLPKPRDPAGFYWVDRPKKGEKSASLMCEDYHPRRSWSDEVLVVADSAAFSGSLEFHLIASNLSEPINTKVAMRVIEQEATWEDAAIVELLGEIVTMEDD